MELDPTERTRPFAIFMAFGTKGDVFPIAAIAGAFASDQTQYRVFLITHSAHEDLSFHLAKKHVDFVAISSPPVLSVNESTGAFDSSFSQQKKIITMEHRRECLSEVERIFGGCPSIAGDFIVINFFALEGWNLAELFHVRCIVAAPYVVPYSAPSSFERHFREELPLLYDYLQTAPTDKVSWNDVIHWMWPLFTENWGSWRSNDLSLSPCPLTDPVTGLPTWHDRPPSPSLLYGFSKEVVEWPDYWPSNIRICGFWFLPTEWQFSCKHCGEKMNFVSSEYHDIKDEFCSAHFKLQSFLKMAASIPPIFIGLSSIGSMGYMRSPLAFLRVLQAALELESHRFILFSAGYEPLDAAIQEVANEAAGHINKKQTVEEGVSLFHGRLFCFSGSIPYNWLFPRCAASVHHGGSGSTAAALHAGIPQVVCPFMLDQFYWAERVFWLGVGSEPLRKEHLVPDDTNNTCIREAANVLLRAINCALAPDVKARALEIAERISHEDGVQEAVRILKEEIIS